LFVCSGVSCLISVDLSLDRFEVMCAVSVQSQRGDSKGVVFDKILDFARNNDLMDKSGVRLFGRRFYPLDLFEPPGYEFYLTLNGDVASLRKAEGVVVRDMPMGLYAFLRVRGADGVSKGWPALFSMVESAGYSPVGVCREVYGWVTAGFEEIVNWQQLGFSHERVVDLWLQLRE